MSVLLDTTLTVTSGEEEEPERREEEPERNKGRPERLSDRRRTVDKHSRPEAAATIICLG